MGQSIVFMFWLDAESSKKISVPDQKKSNKQTNQKNHPGDLTQSRRSLDQGSILVPTVGPINQSAEKISWNPKKNELNFAKKLQSLTRATIFEKVSTVTHRICLINAASFKFGPTPRLMRSSAHTANPEIHSDIWPLWISYLVSCFGEIPTSDPLGFIHESRRFFSEPVLRAQSVSDSRTDSWCSCQSTALLQLAISQLKRPWLHLHCLDIGKFGKMQNLKNNFEGLNNS